MDKQLSEVRVYSGNLIPIDESKIVNKDYHTSMFTLSYFIRNPNIWIGTQELHNHLVELNKEVTRRAIQRQIAKLKNLGLVICLDTHPMSSRLSDYGKQLFGVKS